MSFQFIALQSICSFSTVPPLNTRSHLYFFMIIFVSRAAHKNSNKRHKIFWQQLRRDTENGEMQKKQAENGSKWEREEKQKLEQSSPLLLLLFLLLLDVQWDCERKCDSGCCGATLAAAIPVSVASH